MRLFLLFFCLVCVFFGRANTFGYLPQPTKITIFESNSLELQGPQNELELINNFPFNCYCIYDIPLVGFFYLDSIDDCIKNVLRSGIGWELETKRLIEKMVKPDSTVVDIGAHIGTHTLTMSSCAGKNGKTIAFEPQMKIYTELVMNLQLNKCENVTAYRAAIGNVSGMIQMNEVMIDNGTINEGATGIGQGGDYVYSLRLDDLQLTNVSFIKIDVENVEDQVLQGARNTIALNRPVILVEIMGNQVYCPHDREERAAATIKLIEEMSYRVEHFNCCDYIAYPFH